MAAIKALVGNAGSPTPSELGFKTLAESLGHTVQFVTCAGADAATVTGGTTPAVFLESISSSDVHASWKTTTAPWFSFESGSGVVVAMGLATGSMTGSSNTTVNVASESPWAAGFAGNTRISTTGQLGMYKLSGFVGKVGAGAQIDLYPPSNSVDAHAWHYEPGATLADGSTAAGRRGIWAMLDGGTVDVFTTNEAQTSLNADGRTIIGAILTWLTSGANSLPTATLTASPSTANVGASVQLQLAGTDPDGTVTGYQVEQTGGTPVSLSSSSSASPTFTAPASAGTLTFRGRVIDNSGGQSPWVTTTVTVVQAGQIARPSGDVTKPAGWKAYTSGGTETATFYSTINEATASTASRIETAASPTYAAEYRATLDPGLDAPDTMEGTYFELSAGRSPTSATGKVRVRLFQGAATTPVASWELTGLAVLSPGDAAILLTTPPLTSAEAAAITNVAALQVGVAFEVS